jgi:quinol monooxygenase YgiN
MQAEQQRIARYVRMLARPGRRDALAATLLRVANRLREDPGCELYLINTADDDPDAVWITELWTDRASSDRALGGPLGQAEIGSVVELLAGPPDLVELRPLGGAGLAP